jgi:hypothetical protein
MNGEESVERAVSGDGAGGDILCACAKFVIDVSNLTLSEFSRLEAGLVLNTNLEELSLSEAEEGATGLREVSKNGNPRIRNTHI